MTTTHTGVLIVESLRPDCTLTVPEMVVHGIHRFPTADPSTPVWTLLAFEVPDEHADSLAQQLRTALTDGPWYADFGNATHGLRLGIPEHQLDWTE